MKSPRSGLCPRALVASLLALAAVQAVPAQESAGTVGPDVTVISLQSTLNFGAVDGIHAYSVGTTSCNVGDQPLWWCDEDRAYCDDTQHPVIAQNLYRLKDGRFEQLGASWLKHGFFSVNQPDVSCGPSCGPTLGGDQLGVGCTDPYSASLNGERGRNFGGRSEVHPTSGLFPFPATEVPFPQVIDQRLQVAQNDLDPVLNTGALYWVEGHYVAADDAAAGNGLNNASYRQVTVAGGSLDLQVTGATFREQPAIAAWPTIDPEVELLTLDSASLAGTERFHVARKVTELEGGLFHYEYAVHNLNSNRGARALLVAFPAATTISGVGFRDVDAHSGEPYDTTDWDTAVGADSIEWSTETCDVAPNANALRWGTMYSFWFDADRPPAGIRHRLDLFEVFTPEAIEFEFPAGILSEDFEGGDTGGFTKHPGSGAPAAEARDGNEKREGRRISRRPLKVRGSG
jgi:hypothetical protein